MVHWLVVLFQLLTQPATLQERPAESIRIHSPSFMHDDLLDGLVDGTTNLREAQTDSLRRQRLGRQWLWRVGAETRPDEPWPALASAGGTR